MRQVSLILCSLFVMHILRTSLFFIYFLDSIKINAKLKNRSLVACEGFEQITITAQ